MFESSAPPVTLCQVSGRGPRNPQPSRRQVAREARARRLAAVRLAYQTTRTEIGSSNSRSNVKK